MKPTLKILLALSIVSTILTMSSCKKTYDEGPDFSLRSKMNRITGKWRLVSMEGVERLNPEVEQYMILTKDPAYDYYYKANFINFQEKTGYAHGSIGEGLLTADGYWRFYDGAFGSSCNIGEYLDKYEGIDLIVDTAIRSCARDRWKILRLTNKELKIVNNVCIEHPCVYYWSDRTLTFEKE